MNRNQTLHRFTVACLMLCMALLGRITPASAQDGGRQITGTVTDDLNEPLIGASILVTGASTGTITDLNGNFSIRLPDGKTEIQVSYIGYVTQTLRVGSGNVLNVQMKTDAFTLSDIVVIGYGTQRIKRCKKKNI